MKRKASSVPQTPTKVRVTDVFQVRKVTASPSKKGSLPKTPNKETIASAYSPVKSLFSRNISSGRISGREVEQDVIHSYVTRLLDAKHGGSIYVNGPPGTGKTAVVSQVLHQLRTSKRHQHIILNCNTLNNPKEIYSKICEELLQEYPQTVSSSLALLKRHFTSSKLASIVVLDEIDALTGIHQDLLYNLFQLPFEKNSKLILLGIANALDLTDRNLPRLKAKAMKLETLNFKPYSCKEIVKIIECRLMDLAARYQNGTLPPPFDPAALQLCARKVSTQTGDIRTAFDICRRAIEVVEEETRQEVCSREPLQVIDGNARRATNARHTIPFKTVTMAHVSKVSATMFGGSTGQRLKALTLHQKAALCALQAMESKPASADGITITSLHNKYRALCTRDKLLTPLSYSEFQDVVGALDDVGLAGLSALSTSPIKKQKASGRRIASKVTTMDLLSAVGDIGALKRFLMDA